jgi:hypothetical protein
MGQSTLDDSTDFGGDFCYPKSPANRFRWLIQVDKKLLEIVCKVSLMVIVCGSVFLAGYSVGKQRNPGNELFNQIESKIKESSGE